MFDGKMKAVTFSYDDGITQDTRFIQLLDKYNLKATFNINSGLFGVQNTLYAGELPIAHNRYCEDEIKEVYKNHELAMHTLTHPLLPTLPEDEVVYQVETDRQNLSRLCGYNVVGGAYPCGGVNNDERVAKIIKEQTGVKYCRTIESTGNFDLQDNLYRFNPSVYHLDFDKMMELGKEFVALKPETPKLFYIWGHSYELDIDNNWEKIEEFFKLISNKDDIFYGTNSQVLL